MATAPEGRCGAPGLFQAVKLAHVASAFAYLMLLSAGTAPAAELPPELQEKQRWIKQVEEGDYLFWKRTLDRYQHPGEWNPPASFYMPRVVVNGGEDEYFPVSRSPAAIRPDAIARAWAYAKERNTQALLVLYKGHNAAEFYAEGYQQGSIVNARSMTKTLVGIAFGIAIKDHAIRSLDDAVGQYLHEWNGDARGRITLRELLQNISGLEMPLSTAPDSKGVQLTNGTHVDETALSFDLSQAPGEAFAQNNANTQILGIVLQRATGVTLSRYLSDKIWIPLGASRALMKQDNIGGHDVAYCCFESSGRDWMRLGEMLLNNGKLRNGKELLPANWVAEMLKASKVNPNYGLHIWRGDPFAPRRSYTPSLPGLPANLQSEPFKAHDLFFLDGGAKTRLWIVPSLRLVIARFGNEPSRELGFDEAFIPNAIISGIRPQ